MKQHLDVTVTGRVQGVGFRNAARRFAEEIGICGYAKNLDDGSVLLEIEGEAAAVQSFVTWCKEGPRHALVESMEVAEGEMQGYTEFSTQ